MAASHKTLPSRRERRRRAVWARRGSLLMLTLLVSAMGAAVAVNGVNPAAYGAAEPFRMTRADAIDTSRSQARAPLSSANGLTVDGSWQADDGGLDADKLVGWQADNHVVMELLNGRDKDSVPAGFDPDHADGDTDGNAYPFSECTW